MKKFIIKETVTGAENFSANTVSGHIKIKTKSAFNITAIVVAIVCSLSAEFLGQTANAQVNWNLTGNTNATSTSILGTTNALPLRLTTNNKTRIFIDPSGRVGIGTSVPANSALVVNTTKENSYAIFGSDTTGVSISNSSIAFNTFFNGRLTNMAAGFSGAMVLNQANGALDFYNTAAAAKGPTALVNRMSIDKNGFVGIGTTEPTAQLHVVGDYEGLLVSNSGFNIGVEFNKTNSQSGAPTLLVLNSGFGPAIQTHSTKGNGVEASTGNSSYYAGYFNGTVFTTGTYQGSDEKLKQNIRDFTGAMSIINALHPKQYQFKKDGNYSLMNFPKGDHYGLIAQEVEKVLPNLVKETKFDTRIAKHTETEKSSPGDEVNFKALDYTELIPILIKAVQEQQTEIDELKQKSFSSGSTAQNVVSLSNALLEQNVPNPLTNNTSIRYTIPAGSKAQLTIIDNNGNTIKQIPLNGDSKGIVNIETSAFSAGMYLYTLMVDGKKIATKKMVIAK
jgi:Chaperone of endosialidase/Secretion system C-terminal sorting domain